MRRFEGTAGLRGYRLRGERLLPCSDTVELWRSLGKSIFGIQILRCLVEKLNRAGNNRLGTDSSACERHNRQTALETLTVRSTADTFLQLCICFPNHTSARGSRVPFAGALCGCPWRLPGRCAVPASRSVGSQDGFVLPSHKAVAEGTTAESNPPAPGRQENQAGGKRPCLNRWFSVMFSADHPCHLRGGACPEQHGGAQATASPPPSQPPEVGQ